MLKRGRKERKTMSCLGKALQRRYEVEHYTKHRHDGYFNGYMYAYRHRKVVLKIVINATHTA